MNLYTPIKIIVADDHELYRDGFSCMLKKQQDIEIAGEAKNGEEMVTMTRLLKPDIIISDIIMPAMNGVEATKNILKEFPHIGVIALSMSNEDRLLVEMMEAGAQGYLLKNAYKDEIIQAIKTVYKGGNYYCRDTTKKLTRLLSNSNYIHPRKAYKPLFSDKDLAIIRLICKEYTSLEIADQLQHSIRTIDSYRTNILKKMNVKTVTGLVMYAIKHRLYLPEETA